MENEFINYLDSIIKQLEILKINAKKEIESEYFNLYCILPSYSNIICNKSFGIYGTIINNIINLIIILF